MQSSGILQARVTEKTLCVPEHLRVAPLKINALLPNTAAQPLYLQRNVDARCGAEMLLDRGADAAPVVENGRACGIFSVHDALRGWMQGKADPSSLSVGDLMAPATFSARPDDLVSEALARMNTENLRYLPVVTAASIILLTREQLLEAWAAHLAAIYREIKLDQQVAFLRGTYSC